MYNIGKSQARQFSQEEHTSVEGSRSTVYDT